MPRTSPRGQLVNTWTSGTDTVELRWPADADLSDLVTSPSSAAGAAVSPYASTRSTGVQYTSTHRAFEYQVFRFTDFVPATAPVACQTFQVRVFDTDIAQLTQVSDRLAGQIFRGAALVASSLDSNEMPRAAACHVPAGASAVPNQGGPIEGPAYATSARALQAFIENRHVPQAGYTQITAADGSVAFAWKALPTDDWAVVVHASLSAAGWTVDWWDAAGC